jgi:hypothetical protein
MKVDFRVVQPWGPDKATQSTIISEQVTAADAFSAIDRLACPRTDLSLISPAAPGCGTFVLDLRLTGPRCPGVNARGETVCCPRLQALPVCSAPRAGEAASSSRI